MPSESSAFKIISIVKPGLSKKEFIKHYPVENVRTYRTESEQEWITYYDHDFFTFYFEKGILNSWEVNDREEIVQEYLSEFCSQGILQSMPKMREAITKAFNGIPQDVFISVTDRHRPVLITDYNSSGMSRFATSSEIIALPEDPPAFQSGMTLIKLSTELEEGSVDAITAVVLHELAHRYLGHSQQKKHTCDMEREANQQVKAWGFSEAFAQAKEQFGESQRDGSENCK